ncbi:hypothetical protein B6N60_01238 [Richelia sinica FACHB-800]|uniref:Uncharacterized protein n=1 Tax=Richelia sinica FACHB-800 TaxID=1357546 RepID=A0A975T5Q2_9NOST|nr:hypothetical protein B6N60_01238 [Richelia sinica FACHB-800]
MITVVTIPVLIGIFGSATPNYAYAATPPNQHSEVKPQQPHKKPQIKGRKHHKKRQFHRSSDRAHLMDRHRL